MKILITGSTGFIGKNLVKRLLKKEHDIYCFVRKTSDISFLKTTRSKLITCCLTNGEEVLERIKQIQPDVVFHAAASVMDKDKEKLHVANVIGTRNICSSCYEVKIDKLIYLSSIAVISGNKDMPLVEKLPYLSTNPYGESKIEAEKVAVEYMKKGLKTVIIRPCMVYGEEEPHAFGKILEKIKKRQIPILDIPGVDSKLNLVYIENVVQILEMVLEKEEAIGKTFIVADKEIITIKKFLEILYREVSETYPPVVPGWLVRLLMVLPPVGRRINKYFKDRVYSISYAEEVLGYKPEVSTEEGLKKSIRYWKENKESAGKTLDEDLLI